MRAVLVIGVAAAALAAPSTAAAASQNGRIAVVAADGRLVTMNPDGSGTHVVSAVGDTDPAWSSSGMMLAVSSPTTGNGDIYLRSPDGRTGGRFAGFLDPERHPAWAPCDCELAFDRSHDGDSAVYLIGADATREHLVADAPGCDEEPSFAPDNQRVAFVSCRSGRPQIWVVNVDGTGLTQITHDDGDDGNPAWSPNGRQIAYDSTRNGLQQIWIADADGANAYAASDGPADEQPAWSPDGTAIAYDDAADSTAYVSTLVGDWRHVLAYGGGNVAWQRGDAASTCTYPGTAGDDYVAGGDGADVVCGEAGDDTVVGGPGSDVLLGGQGNDVLDARDGEPDVVDGGGGLDTAFVDRGDRVLHVEHVVRPDPMNLARGRPVTASLALADGAASFANDGFRRYGWAASAAPQWIEIDLGRRRRIREIELVVAQDPAGQTVHVVSGRGARTEILHRLHVFTGRTKDKEVLAYAPRRPWRGIRFVRVDTLFSPSWVGWREIRVFG